MKNLGTDIPQNILDEIEEYLNVEFLPSNLCIGRVIKIHTSGTLEEDGFEKGYLFLPKGSGIKQHYHKFDEEKYTLISGRLSINNQEVEENYCNIGECHSIDPVMEDTLICYHKVKVLEDSNKTSNEKQKVKFYI